ncbi:CGI-121-domain-containing protein, partial [Leucogyrophana mollusca]
MDILRYPQFPAHLSAVYVALFSEVNNAAALRSRIVKAASIPGAEGDAEREAVNFAFIDARLITSYLHLQTAIYQAILAASQDGLRTKTVHSEILWALNPTNNITEAIRRYGVSDTSGTLLVVHVASPDVADVQSKMAAVSSGSISPLSALGKTTDLASVKKHYKLNTEPAVIEAAGNPELERAIIDNIVVSSVAMKSVM